MNFNLKIIFVTLAILISSLLLNSFLSLASFEKIYVDSLISTTEIAGASLKVKIEQALKYGKPLERFQNMDNLLEKLIEDDSELLSVGIILPGGEILYHTDRQMIGKAQPIPEMDLKTSTDVATRLIKGNYNTFVPLYDRTKSLKGYVNLIFPRKIVTSKLKTMAFATLNTLWLFIPLTFIGLFVLVSLFIALPIKKDLIKISRLLKWKKAGHGYDAGSLNTETKKRVNRDLDALDTHIRGFVSHTGQKMAQFDMINEKYRGISARVKRLNALESQLDCTVNKENTMDQDHKNAIRFIMEKQRHIRSMLDLNQNLLNEMLAIEKIEEK